MQQEKELSKKQVNLIEELIDKTITYRAEEVLGAVNKANSLEDINNIKKELYGIHSR